jgi:hypothetical protein
VRNHRGRAALCRSLDAATGRQYVAAVAGTSACHRACACAFKRALAAAAPEGAVVAYTLPYSAG